MPTEIVAASVFRIDKPARGSENPAIRRSRLEARGGGDLSARDPMSDETQIREIRQSFERDGFAVVRGFFDPGETLALRAGVDRYLSEAVPVLPPGKAFFEDKSDPRTLMRCECMEDYDSYFAALKAHPRVLALGRALLRDELAPQRVAMFGKPPRIGKATPPHQDGFYHKLEPNESVTFWIPVDAVDAGNGCLRYLPGSHRKGLRHHEQSEVFGFSLGIPDFGEADRAAEVEVCLEPGDFVVHHGLTVHRTDPNPSDRTRHAVGLVYFAARARVDTEAREAHRREVEAKWQARGRL